MDMVNKIEELKENEAFKAKLEAAADVDDIIRAFADEGIEVTEEDLKAAMRLINEDNELNEDALEAVSGGSFSVLAGIALVIIGCAIAVPVMNWLVKKSKNFWD